MTEPHHCETCGGDGGWSVGDGPIWRWFECRVCEGAGEIDVPVVLIEMEDLDRDG